VDASALVAELKSVLSEDDGEKRAADLIQEATNGLISKRDELLDEVKKVKKKLRDYEGIDPTEYTEMKERLEELEAAANKSSGNLEETIKKLEEKHKKETDKLTADLAQERGAVSRLVVEKGLTDALAAAGVTEAGLKFARAFFLPQVQVEADGEERVAKIGENTLESAVAEWAKSDEAKLFLRAQSSSGGGASGGSQGSSGAKTMTRTEFDGLEPAARMEFVRDGGQVVNQ
jgi:vacuolar-type H+-ATPase subunit I/STV1